MRKKQRRIFLIWRVDIRKLEIWNYKFILFKAIKNNNKKKTSLYPTWLFSKILSLWQNICENQLTTGKNIFTHCVRGCSSWLTCFIALSLWWDKNIMAAGGCCRAILCISWQPGSPGEENEREGLETKYTLYGIYPVIYFLQLGSISYY